MEYELNSLENLAGFPYDMTNRIILITVLM